MTKKANAPNITANIASKMAGNAVNIVSSARNINANAPNIATNAPMSQVGQVPTGVTCSPSSPLTGCLTTLGHACSGKSVNFTPLNQVEKNLIVQIHNEKRSLVFDL
jgi:hypothetical protein